MSLLHRPYDAAFSPEALEQVRRRRGNPDGVERRVRRERLPGEPGHKNIYPWDEMKLGDYFYVGIPSGVHFSAMRTRFKQVALRRDFEITCTKWELGTPEMPNPGVRVSLTYTGSIRELKEKAGVPAGDGRWTETRKNRRGTCEPTKSRSSGHGHGG